MINAWPDGLTKSTSECQFDRGVGGKERGAGVKSDLGDRRGIFQNWASLSPITGYIAENLAECRME